LWIFKLVLMNLYLPDVVDAAVSRSVGHTPLIVLASTVLVAGCPERIPLGLVNPQQKFLFIIISGR